MAPPSVLPYLVPSGLVISGVASACTAAPSTRRIRSTPDDQVAPLVAAADLQRAAVPPVQLQEVVGLQDLVAELGVADPARFQPGPDRLPAEHLVDREVLADVAEELQRGQRLGPVQVADHQRAGRPGAEKSRNRDTSPRIRSTHSATTSRELSTRSADLPLGSPISPVAPPTSAIGRCPASWKRRMREQQDEVADVQPGRGRVEPAVERDRAGVERLAQLVEVGGQRDQAAPGQLVDDVGHRSIVPPSPAEGETAFGPGRPGARPAGRPTPSGRRSARTATASRRRCSPRPAGPG